MSSGPTQRPLAITMGEPAGIGPELIARIWHKREALDLSPFVYIGSAQVLLGYDNSLEIQLVDDPTEFNSSRNVLQVVDVPTTTPVIAGSLDSSNGQSVIKSIDTAVNLALEGHIAGVVTAPIHKANLYRSGFDAPGHTEYLARKCGFADNHSVMMLATTGLRVVPITAHVPLRDVARVLTADKIVHAAMVTAHDLHVRFGIEQPRLAVAGLNPHAGEGGTIGMEEATHIQPAIWTLRDNGINISDPLPADTLFHAEAREQYDAVLCMYHDQALIPLKTLDFWGGVNITLGLPIIRTSPDHGTALSLAGKGTCRLDSMITAIKTAEELAEPGSDKAQAFRNVETGNG